MCSKSKTGDNPFFSSYPFLFLWPYIIHRKKFNFHIRWWTQRSVHRFELSLICIIRLFNFLGLLFWFSFQNLPQRIFCPFQTEFFLCWLKYSKDLTRNLISMSDQFNLSPIACTQALTIAILVISNIKVEYNVNYFV